MSEEQTPSRISASELRRLLQSLPRGDRRRVRKASTGRATIDDPRLSALAVETARQNITILRIMIIPTALQGARLAVGAHSVSDFAFGAAGLVLFVAEAVVWFRSRRVVRGADAPTNAALEELRREAQRTPSDARRRGRAEVRRE